MIGYRFRFPIVRQAPVLKLIAFDAFPLPRCIGGAFATVVQRCWWGGVGLAGFVGLAGLVGFTGLTGFVEFAGLVWSVCGCDWGCCFMGTDIVEDCPEPAPLPNWMEVAVCRSPL